MTSNASTITFSQDPRVQAILAEYRTSQATGQEMNPQELLARHLDVADPLVAWLTQLDTAVATGSTPGPNGAVSAAVDSHAPTLPFELPPAGVVPASRRDFGDYELIEEIARGGMGVVFKAHQKSLNRTVALKMILAGQLASADQVRRFRHEAEEAGNLDHPHIVPIYQVGEYRGQHFFSMKLIEGGNLNDHAARYRGQPRQAARLMAKVARAVHHAHQRGILHRDLKPGNILIDTQGEPHVADFGLAKHLGGGDALTTHSGAIVGTPSYMSPEQAASRKDLSVATDVWSLGAILYKLLTGRPPFEAETPFDTILAVLEKEPAPPRSLDGALDRDLETICLKCLGKDPQRRYGSALRLAEDLERYLAGEPIQARPVRAPERLLKWVKRRPAAAALCGVCGLALMVLGLGGWVMNLRLKTALDEKETARKVAEEQHLVAVEQGRLAEERRLEAEQQRQAAVQQEHLAEARRLEAEQQRLEAVEQRRLAEARRLEAEQQREVAKRNEDEARRQGALATAGLRNRQDAIERMVLNMDQRLANLSDAEVAAVRLELLQEVLKLSQGLLQEYPKDKTVRQQTAQLYSRIGDLYRLSLRHYPEAGQAYGQALVLREGLVAEFPQQRSYRAELALLHARQARLLRAQRQYPAARAEYERAIRLCEELAAEVPKQASYRENECLYRFERADVLHREGKFAEATQAYRETLDRREQLVSAFPTQPVYHTRLASTAANLSVLVERDQPAEAQRYLERALAAYRQAFKLVPGNRLIYHQLREAYAELEEFFKQRGRHDQLPALADALRQDFPNDQTQTYNAACFLADAVTVVQADRSLAETERDRLTETYALRAIDLLHKAIGEGYKDGAHMDRDSDLDPLRGRADYQALRADLAKHYPVPPPTPAREYAALEREYVVSQDTYESLRTRSPTLAEAQRVRVKAPNLEVVANRFLKLAEQSRDSSAALDALVWVLEKTVNAREPGLVKLRQRALVCLERDHLQKAELASVCQRLCETLASDCEPFFRTVLEKHAQHNVRGLASFALAQAISKQADQAQEAGRPEAAALFQKAEQLFETIVKEYPTVPYSSTTLGEVAKKRLFAQRSLAVGRPAPEVEGVDLDGKKFKLSEYRGQVVVLDFWANWCGWCRKLYPFEKQLMQRLEGRPFALLGVNSDDSWAEVRRVIEREKLPWRSWWDGDGTGYRITNQWQVSSYPTLYVLDHKGVIRYKRNGFPNEQELKNLDKLVDRLVQEAEADRNADNQ